MVLSYLRDHPYLEEEIGYVERLKTFFSEHFQEINRYYIYLTHPAISMSGNLPPDLMETRDILLGGIEDYLRSMKGEFVSIREGWDGFFERFKGAYSARHDLYYQSEIFRLRGEIEGSEEGKVLKRISAVVSSLTFKHDWWEVKREIDRLPETCRAELSQELFSNPVCRCGFRISDEPPSTSIDFIKLCSDGILNFLRLLQQAENREKLDSYILGVNDTGRADVAEKIASLLSLNLNEANLTLILPLLTDDVLKEIERAFKGRWKIREVNLEDFLNMVKGRRFRYREIYDLFLKWVGDEEDSIIWVRDRDDRGIGLLREDLSKYGIQGERISRGLSRGGSGSH